MLINTLAAFFAFTTVISPLEAGVILLITAYAIYLATAKDNQSIADNTHKPIGAGIYMYIHAAWLGRLSLLRAFLPFFVIFNSVLFYIDYRAEMIRYTISSWFMTLVILAIPLIWWTVSVWRCSYNQTHQLITYLCRYLIVLAYYEYILRFMIRYYYPNIWFDCQQIAIELGDCF